MRKVLFTTVALFTIGICSAAMARPMANAADSDTQGEISNGTSGQGTISSSGQGTISTGTGSGTISSGTGHGTITTGKGSGTITGAAASVGARRAGSRAH